MEPIDPPVHVPAGGWPQALLRLELLPAVSFDRAVYEVASFARSFRRGVVSSFDCTLLVAWPHQTVDEIARTWLRLRAEPPAELTTDDPRWTPGRKAWVCDGIRQGWLTTEGVRAAFDISQSELDAWMRAYETGGIRALGLSALRSRTG